MKAIVARLRTAAGAIIAWGVLWSCASSSVGPVNSVTPSGSASAAAVPLTSGNPGALKKPGEKPFTNASWYVDMYSSVVAHANALRKERPVDAALLEKIAKYGGADWVGE